MRYRHLALALVALFTILRPVFGEQAGLSKVYVINYDQTRKITLTLPEGYAARRDPSFKDDAILCPWNEYFLISSSSIPASTGKVVKDEQALAVELEQLARGHQGQGMEIRNRQLWSTAKGPMASLEIWGKVDGKVTAGTELLMPVGAELWIVSLTGYDSSLADQQVIQKLLIAELSR